VLAQLPAEKPKAYDQLMKELAETGVEGVKILVGMMNPPGKGDNSAVEYALSGLTHYASADEILKNKTEQAFIAALDETNERETKAFIIRQLALVGSDAGINKLSGYLTEDELSSPAACAIASIGGESAGKALQMALMSRSARSPEAQRNIIQALGDVVPSVSGAEDLLGTMIGTSDLKTKGVVLKALSRTGSKESLAELAAVAAATGYKPEVTDANDAYIQLIKRVYGQGETKEAFAAAQGLLKNATKAGSPQIRIAALEVIFLTQPDKLKTLKTALKDGNKAYRNAALRYASDYADKAMYTEMFKMLPKAKTEDKVDVLNWIGREAQCPDKKQVLKVIETGIDRTGTHTLVQLLDNSDFEVKQAAAGALGTIGDKDALPALTDLFKSNDLQIISLAKNVLSSFDGDISPSLAKVVSQASDKGKIAAIELFSLHKADAYLTTVMEQTKSASPEVKNAAYKALKDVVSEKDVVVLCGMLETAETSFVSPLQQAVASAISSLSPEKQTETVTGRMLQAGDSKKYLYYPVLSSTGDPAALEIIVQGVNEGSGSSKDAAFEALRSWKGFDAEEALYAICKTSSSPYHEKAVDSYIALVSGEKMTGENRLIFLRKAMEVAGTDEQKNKILKNIGKTGTYLAMLYAGEFIDDQALKENAALAIMEIALANKNYTGTNVKELLNKAASALNNPDADYQRQAIRKHLDEMPDEAGFVSLFNGKDLTGWKGLVANPVQRAKMKPAALNSAQVKADEVMRSGWSAVDGELVFNGKGDNICTEKQYGDFEMYVDWKLDPAGPEPDAGIYLRGTPQVQIWDTSRVNVGAQVGSGGLYNNTVNPSKPLKVADNKLGEWNTLYIKMVGDRVTVRLNGELVVDNVILENYWDRSQPIPAVEQIELQAHGSKVYYRNLYVRELKRTEPYKLSENEQKEGFKILFDGTNMHEWTGNLVDYKMEDGCISVAADTKYGGNLYTKKEYANFIYRFDFQLTPAANNGVGIRTPLEGDAAYVGMEIQILDSEHPVYKKLHDYQYHGSVYGIIPAKRGYLKPVGEWNTQEIVADGNHIKVTLNGVVILDGDIKEATANGTMDGKEHPGLFNKSGHIGFLGHGSAVKFRNIRIKELK
jgi:HEAT repeat protein